VITYEYPLNERVRTLLRLEDLYERVNHFLPGDHPLDHHAALAGIFEILEVASRADLKSDLLQELDRQRTFLDALRSNPAISETKLDQVLGEIESAFANLHGLSGKTGQNLRENEWLMAIKQRTGIPGGTSEFDLPSYHYWLHRDADARRADLAEWMKALNPVHAALSIVLRVLRESGRTVTLTAPQGVFQQTPAEKPAQMLRLTLASDVPCIPEISANKYALNIRFLVPEGVQKSRVYDRDVQFELAFCNL
jgi:cell division protein ZapD